MDAAVFVAGGPAATGGAMQNSRIREYIRENRSENRSIDRRIVSTIPFRHTSIKALND